MVKALESVKGVIERGNRSYLDGLGNTLTGSVQPICTQERGANGDATEIHDNLREKIQELRVEIDQSKKLDLEKKTTMEKMLEQVKGAIDRNENADCKIPSDESTPSAADHLRRTTVAIAGGTLTAAGVVLIPCPIIPGCLVVYAGLAVLATEFDTAKNALEEVKKPVAKWLADDGQGGAGKAAGENSLLWEQMIGYMDGSSRKHDIDCEFRVMMDTPSSQVRTEIN
ncbi:hypothetical protein ACHAWF_004515 [Thalassiosira exigua]